MPSDEMVAVARRHVAVEAVRDLEATPGTLDDEPSRIMFGPMWGELEIIDG